MPKMLDDGAADEISATLAPVMVDGPPERVFARRMKRERQRRGWRQEDLAAHLAAMSLDLHPSTIAKMEREPDFEKRVEPRMIRLNEAHAIAQVLRLSIDQMLTDDDLTDAARELEHLHAQLAAIRTEREHMNQRLLETEHTIDAIEQQIAEVNKLAQARHQERQQATAVGRAFILQRLAEAEHRTNAARTRITDIRQILNNRRGDLTSQRPNLEQLFRDEGPAAFAAAVGQGLAAADYPEGIHASFTANYIDDRRSLVIACDLPGPDIVPPASSYRYNQSADLIQPEPRPHAEAAQLYAMFLASVALRTLAEAFDLAPVSLVEGATIAVHAAPQHRPDATAVKPCLLSVHAAREDFESLHLSNLDPLVCLRSLNAQLSQRPVDLEPVQPMVELPMPASEQHWTSNRPNLETGMDLLALSPTQFEHLVRELLQAMGFEACVTQQSNDQGMDAVAAVADPATGGVCVISAKRYTRIVGPEALHALRDAMEDLRAAQGLLITTSWVGKAGRDFTERNPITIIDGVALRSLIREHLGIEVRISLPKLPAGWKRSDVA